MTGYKAKKYNSINDLQEAYLAYMEMNGATVATIHTYGKITARFIRWLESTTEIKFTEEGVAAIRPATIVQHYATMSDLSIGTKNISVNALRSMFNYLKDMGYVQGDPCAPLRVQTKRREKYELSPDEAPQNMITAEEAIKLISHKSSYNGLRNRAIIALILGTGLRAFEVSELTIGTIRNMKRGMIYCHRKGNIWRYVPVPQPALEYVLDYLNTRGGVNSPELKDEDPLFASHFGGFMTVRTIQHSINEIQKSLGMKTGLHLLRHTALTGVQHSGGLAVARDIASHSNLGVTNIYLHSTPEERVKAAEQLPWFNTIRE